jgi:hypothetical protein
MRADDHPQGAGRAIAFACPSIGAPAHKPGRGLVWGTVVPFTITKTKLKQSLGAKTKTHKKGLEHAVKLEGMAATAGASLLPDLMLERRNINALKEFNRRVRKSEKGQIERVTKSIATLKQCVPIAISAEGEIINGHIVIAALRALGETEVWCVIIDHLDEHQLAMLHVSLNRIAECGDWDLEALGGLLIDLGELEFDLEATGFTLPEIDILMTPETSSKSGGDQHDVEPPADPVTIAGDLWELGRHRLLCGDATDPASYYALLKDELADLVFTDCPWNIPIAGFVSGLGKTKHPDFKMGVGSGHRKSSPNFAIPFMLWPRGTFGPAAYSSPVSTGGPLI